MSGCHKLDLPVFKTTFSNSKPKEIIYRNFKKFNQEDFNEELRLKLSTEFVNNYSSFESVFIDVLNKHAPIREKVARDKHAHYVTKALRKVIMKGFQLEKLYFKKRTQESFKRYKIQKKLLQKIIQTRAQKLFGKPRF